MTRQATSKTRGVMELVFLLIVWITVIEASNTGTAPIIREQPSDIVARRNDPATLNCAATGAARITWYRNGQQVMTSSQDQRSHRVLLPSGSLFFLRVSTNRRDLDAGLYWCVASNSHGATRSSNATLTVASLGYDFEGPLDPETKVLNGSSITLPCGPPKGTPAPKMIWLKDGQEVVNSSRITVAENGDLLISHTLQDDAGTYLCRARNIAGVRDSAPTQLLVMIPPWFEESPTDITAASGIVVELPCKAQGLPQPSITWRKSDGKMPLERTMIGDDHNLVLQRVETTESGVYICEAKSEAGVATAKATLTVVDAPSLVQKPQDKQVVVGESTKLSCIVEGDPAPLIIWRLPTQDRTALLTPSQASGHVSVSSDGQTLNLNELAITDRGNYYCWGISSGGGVSAKAEIVVVEAFPPPVIGIGPRDVTAAPGSVASFSCEAVSEAASLSVSWWYRPAAHIPAHQLTETSNNSRLSFKDNGAIILKDLQPSDSGIYECRITAETGRIQQEALLKVVDDAIKGNPSKLPAPPSKPNLVSVNETSAHLTWLPNSQVQSDSEQWYVVEFWQRDWEEWRVAETDLIEESCLITGLTPGRTYFFLIRAVDNDGISFPSPWSDPIITFPTKDLPHFEDQNRFPKRRLSRPLVTITNANVTAPDSVLLNWRFMSTLETTVEGVLVYAIASKKTVQVATILGSTSSSHHLQNLKPNTNYTFFLVPFWHGVEGTPSNSMSVLTPEDVPVSAPGNVHVEAREDGSTLITWNTLSAWEARGEIVGYQVSLSYNGTQTTETVVNPWLEARGLVPGRLYTVRVAALTGVGAGPFSAPVLMNGGTKPGQKNHESTSLINDNTSVLYAQPEPEWLVYLLVPLVIVLFLATLLYIRRLRHKPPSSNIPHTPPLYQDSSLYPAQHSVQVYNEKKLWHSSDSDKDSSLSSTRLLRPNHQINEYAEPRIQQVSEGAEPYATTALLAPESPHLNRGPPWRHQSDDSGVQVNWSAILPPPPACPPPKDLDLGDPRRSADPHNIHIMRNAVSQRSSISGSEQYKRPCDSTSEYSYDVYSQMTPNESQTGYHTYNALQSCGCIEVNIENNKSDKSDPLQRA